MAFEIPKQPYSGEIGETTLGGGSGAVKLGGEDSYPLHLFEGKMPNPPKIAMEVWDYDPSEEWPAAAVEPFKDVVSSPEAWAKKCVEEYGADMIVLQLKSTDPNGMDRGADEAAEVAKKGPMFVRTHVTYDGAGEPNVFRHTHRMFVAFGAPLVPQSFFGSMRMPCSYVRTYVCSDGTYVRTGVRGASDR